MGHELLGDNDPGAVCQPGAGEAFGGIYALDLDGLHLHEAVFAHFHPRLRVHNAPAPAVAAAVMLFHVLYMGIFPYVKGVYAVMPAVAVAAVMDAAAGYDGHVTVIAHMEIVIDHFGQSALA